MDPEETQSESPSFVVISTDSQYSQPNSFNEQNLNSLRTMDLQTRIQSLLQENAELKDTLHQNNLSMKIQFENLAMYQDQVAELHKTHREKFIETKELVLKLRNENACLKKQLENIVTANPADVIQLERDKTILIKERDAFRDECSRLNAKVNELQHTLRAKNDQLDSIRLDKRLISMAQDDMLKELGLRKHSPELKPPRKPDDSSSWSYLVDGEAEETLTVIDLPVETKLRLNESSESAATLFQNNDTLRLKADLAIANEENYRLKDKLTKLNKDIETMESQKKSMDDEIKLFRLQNEQLTLQCSEVEILKAQVSVYQEDFKAEREAREKVATEKEKFAEESRRLRARVEDLERLLKSVNKHCPTPEVATSSNSTQAPSSSNLQNATQETQEKSPSPVKITVHVEHECIGCGNVFTSIEDLQQHINPCLDKLVASQ